MSQSLAPSMDVIPLPPPQSSEFRARRQLRQPASAAELDIYLPLPLIDTMSPPRLGLAPSKPLRGERDARQADLTPATSGFPRSSPQAVAATDRVGASDRSSPTGLITPDTAIVSASPLTTVCPAMSVDDRSVRESESTPAESPPIDVSVAESDEQIRFTELYLRLRSSLPPSVVRPLIAIAGLRTGDGATTNTLRIAVAAARQLGQRVLVVEADQSGLNSTSTQPVSARGRGRSKPRESRASANRRSLAERLGIVDVPGWRDWLAGRAEIEDVAHATSVAGLDVLPVGFGAESGRWEPLANHLRRAIEQLPIVYDTVLIDFGALERRATSTSLGQGCGPHGALLPLVSGVAIVVNARRADSVSANQVLDRLRRDRVRILGVVLSEHDQRRPKPR